ncbi:MAG: hypothetical protein ACJAWX_001887 [Algoriphagus sp.]
MKQIFFAEKALFLKSVKEISFKGNMSDFVRFN